MVRNELEQLTHKYASKDSELLLAQQSINELKQRLRKDNSLSPAATSMVRETSPSKIQVTNNLNSKHFYERLKKLGRSPTSFAQQSVTSLNRVNETLREEKLELETRFMCLSRYKMYYNCSGQIQCKGCLRNFKPAIFKGSHITQCKQLSAMGYNQKKEHSVYEKDQPMTVKVSEVDNEGFTKFLICYCGITWFTSVAIHQIQAVVQ